MREICTSGSIGRGPETGSRRRLNGHEAGNGGHGQVNAYGVPRRPPTLPCSAASRAYIRAASVSPLSVAPMEPMKHPVDQGRQNDARDHQKDHPAVERVEAGKQLAAWCRWRLDWPHSAEEHGCVQERIQPAETLEVRVAHHAAKQRSREYQTRHGKVACNTSEERPDRHDPLVMPFVHERPPHLVSRTPGISCKAPKLTGPCQLPLFGGPVYVAWSFAFSGSQRSKALLSSCNSVAGTIRFGSSIAQAADT